MPPALSSSRNRGPRRAAAPARRRRCWSRLSDEELLKLRFCDLGLRLEGTPLERRLHRIYDELASRGIGFRPHLWLAEEWFSPDGVPGIAVPFYLAHPRLERLERTMMKQVEGGNRQWLMRILRHEAGHAVDTAYRLRRRRCFRDTFGPASLPYPERYRARPASRRYVQHLGEWYAQSHPTEDFAETFAVWLKPRSNWRRVYERWPAQRKLELVDALMDEVRARRPAVRTRARIESLADNRRTLAEHYAEKIARLAAQRGGAADAELRRVFTPVPPRPTARRASALLREAKSGLVDAVARECEVDRYTVHQVLRFAIARSNRLGLRLRGSQREALRRSRRLLVRLVERYARGESPQLCL